MLHPHLMAHARACGVRVHVALLAASPNSPAPLGSLLDVLGAGQQEVHDEDGEEDPDQQSHPRHEHRPPVAPDPLDGRVQLVCVEEDVGQPLQGSLTVHDEVVLEVVAVASEVVAGVADQQEASLPIGQHGCQCGITGRSVNGGDTLASYHAADVAGLLLCLTGTGVSAEDLTE